MMKYGLGSIFALMLFTFSAMANADSFHLDSVASSWIDKSGPNCQTACRENGLRPVVTGLNNGKRNMRFTVCRADVAGTGFRPGYSLTNFFPGNCFVAFGGKETAMTSYQCLCLPSRR